ncbi:MAG: hypothetical protein IT454_15975 [Planctomycetes bacterium]|nr:hypothetical protein [Planctomycetota bacterium]
MKLQHLSLAFSFVAPAFAQGSDACSAAQAITGVGSFAFDSSSATTDGSPANLCYSSGSAQIERDVWFRWTAPSSGYFTFATCAQTAIDSRLALYDGSCAGAVLACNDDACGLQSQIGYTAVAGLDYLLRVGSFPGTPGGPGQVTITALTPPQVLYTAVNPANNHLYAIIDYASWKDCEARAVQLGAHLAQVEDQAENDWIQQNLIGAVAGANNLWIGLSDELVEGTWAWSNGSSSTFLNWDTGQPDNYGNEDHAYMRPNGFWNDVPNAGGGANPRGLVEFDCGAPPASYCTSGTSSLGCSATLGSSGTPSASSASGFVLSVTNVDAQRQGLIFYGTSGAQAIAWGTSTSFLCVKPPTQRTAVQSSNGTAGQCDGALGIDFNTFMATHPTALGQPFAGTTVFAQGWYRDPPNPKTTMLSDALSFNVCP